MKNMVSMLILHSEINADFEEAFEYFAQYGIEKAIDFNESFNRVISRIQQNPYQFPILYDEYRKALLSKPFEYKIIFRMLNDSAYIIALVHNKRHPDFWKKRLEIRQ